MPGPKPLLRCFKVSGESADLLARAATLAMYNQVLRPHLPDPLDRHCVLANVRGATAILAADSAGWASRLRYLAPALLPRLADMGLVVSRIEVVVMPPTTPPVRPQRQITSAPSLEVALALESFAARTEDAGLAAVLRRLASRAKPPLV
ncbi:MAG TPA: DciA family protein [Candidatus Macondimonas sp.]|jgi:hypothetical protein|nr:DciA family protein [Candidatus Macondimonas sp.]